MLPFFPLDLIMDFCLLCCVQLALDRIRLKRLTAALAILSAHSCCASFLPLFRRGSMTLAACIAASAALTKGRSVRKTAEAAACMLCISAACGGFATMAGASSRRFLPMALTGAMLTLALLRKRRHICYRWNIEVYLEKDGLSACFPALIDTGNRLREHRSGLPVLIAESAAMPELAEYMETKRNDQLRTLPFGVLGSSGEISCFRADCVLLHFSGERWHIAPECMIAVYHGRIPGRIRALAPPEFTEAAGNGMPFSFRIQNTMRRFHYVFFKHAAIHLRPGGTDSEGIGMLHRRQ